tara:strand:- start:13 stop:384 length:372 start_codon:yes stop_codon:yes gene_type:complete
MATRKLKFKKDDDIECELSPELDAPRYNGINRDLGASGQWTWGYISDIISTRYELTVWIGSDLKVFTVPNENSRFYNQDIWNQPGYVKHKNEPRQGPNCECGMGNSSATHFFFCPRHKKVNEN